MVREGEETIPTPEVVWGEAGPRPAGFSGICPSRAESFSMSMSGVGEPPGPRERVRQMGHTVPEHFSGILPRLFKQVHPMFLYQQAGIVPHILPMHGF